MTVVSVEAAVAGRRRASAPEHELRVALPEGATTLAALLEAIVRAEVASFLERAEGEKLVQVLTQQALEEGLASGSVRSGGREVAAEVDVDQAVQTALVAQVDGLFQTIVDDRPVDDLDEVIDLRDGLRVMFLRLVPLAGG